MIYFNGPFENYHKNGNLKQKYTFVDGELNDLEIYYENGQLSYKSNYLVFFKWTG